MAATKKTASKKKSGKGTAQSAAVKQKKSSKSVKSTRTTGASNKNLVKKLTDIATGLSEDGLKYLIQQALVLQYNQHVDEVNESILSQQSKKTAKTASKSAKTGKTSGAAVDIIEADDLSHFILKIYQERNFFSREEMRSIVKICQSADSASDGARRLFTWFEKNRSDVIKNSPLSGPGDAALAKLYDSIVSTYTVNK